MKRILILFVWNLILTGCASHTKIAVNAAKPIHPQIFEMVECWLSDTASPVVTEINLTAVERNRNQFSYSRLKADGDWIEFDCTEEGGGYAFLRYKVLESKGDQQNILFQSNGGGTLTRQCEIGFRIYNREIDIDGKKTVIQVLSIESIE
ncbi:hypothetical protein BVX97_00645 [bacterium E08(2017)]|nr:hypothetical protein BVX97_00645 [bacterium E08(2017)]